MKLQIINGDYEILYDDDGKILCESYKLDAEDVLAALGYKCKVEEIWERIMKM